MTLGMTHRPHDARQPKGTAYRPATHWLLAHALPRHHPFTSRASWYYDPASDLGEFSGRHFGEVLLYCVKAQKRGFWEASKGRGHLNCAWKGKRASDGKEGKTPPKTKGIIRVRHVWAISDMEKAPRETADVANGWEAGSFTESHLSLALNTPPHPGAHANMGDIPSTCSGPAPH